MNTSLFLPRVPAAALMMTLRVGAPLQSPSDHSAGFHPAVTVASLRAARKHHLVRLSDPARCVVTDFAEEQAFTIADDCGIEEASIAMFRWGAHTLIALHEEKTVVGLLSSEDIEGERVRRFLDSHPEQAFRDILVRDVLTPCGTLPAVDWGTIEHARVSDVLHIVEATECPYFLLLKATDRSEMVLRGLLFRARLMRALEPSI